MLDIGDVVINPLTARLTETCRRAGRTFYRGHNRVDSEVGQI